MTSVDERRVKIGEVIGEVELAINDALLTIGSEEPELRRALLKARAGIREANGEAAT